MSDLLDLHDNLLGGPIGREVNGVAQLRLIALAASGLVIWWPGIEAWRRSLTRASRRGMEAHDVGPAQHGRHLEPWIYPAVCHQRDLSGRSRTSSGPCQPARAPHRIDRPIHLLARHLAFRTHQRHRLSLRGPGLCDQAIKADLGYIRAGPGGNVCHRRDHVVEPRAASPMARRSSDQMIPAL